MQARKSGERGFTLVELLVVIGIITILLSLSTLYFNDMSRKAAIEKEVTTIYSNLAQVRMEALYSKTQRTVTLSGTQFNIYSSSVITPTPISTVALPFPVSTSNNTLLFDSTGMLLSNETAICVDPSGTLADNNGNVDSVDVAAARGYIGKRTSGGTCIAGNIAQK